MPLTWSIAGRGAGVVAVIPAGIGQIISIHVLLVRYATMGLANLLLLSQLPPGDK
jgi:hypothetical protein